MDYQNAINVFQGYFSNPNTGENVLVKRQFIIIKRVRGLGGINIFNSYREYLIEWDNGLREYVSHSELQKIS